jgi:hypothetical protein
MSSAQLTVSYGNGLSVTLAQGQPLRLSTMQWDFPERPDLIALAERDARLDFLRDHLKSLCGLWDKEPRSFLDAYFRDIRECIRRYRPALDPLAAAHGGLFQPEDWAYSALCPLPQARLPAAPDAVVNFAFWNGAELETVVVLGPASQNRAERAGRARLRESGAHVTEIPGAEFQHASAGDLIAHLPAVLGKFWEGVSLPSSPFRVGALDESLPI